MKSTFFLVSCVIVFSTVMTNGAPIGVDRTEDTSSNVLTSVSLEFIRYEEADPTKGGVFRIVNARTNTVSLSCTLISSKDEKYSPVVIDVEFHGHIKDGWYRLRGNFAPDKIPHVLRISPGTKIVVRCSMIQTLMFPSGVDKWRLVIYAGNSAIVSKSFEFNPETVAAVWYRGGIQ